MKEHKMNTRQESNSYCCFFLFVYFYCFVSLRSEQPAATDIKTAGKDARLTVQGTGLNLCLELLEVVASLPVPEMHASIVPYEGREKEESVWGEYAQQGPNTSRHKDIVRVDSEGVDKCLVACKVLQEIAVWEFPDFNVVR